MAIVQTFRGLQAFTTPAPSPWVDGRTGSIGGYDGHALTYLRLYETQPNIRTVVDFLARNVAQLGVHAFRRVSDTDRVRIAGHDLINWLHHPNPSTTRYRLIESLMQDLGIYFNAYWCKVRNDNNAIGLVRLPPEQMAAEGGLVVTGFTWTQDNGERWHIPASEVVHFSGYRGGISPLETLRRVLAEEMAAGDHRQAFWRNSARIDGVIERPAAAPKWTPDQITSFREQWHAKFSGQAGAGTVAVLTDGMTLRPLAFNAKQNEFVAARKLAREECAAAYHIPLPMVGILEHATFSNIREQHKHLYQDCLGPWLVMIAEELERQLLTECEDQRDVYIEFNIAEKLSGSFEEQAASLQTLVGGPVMTRNEGRARLNLPAMPDDGANRLITPLNVSDRGDADDDTATIPPTPPADRGTLLTFPAVATDVVPIIESAWRRQAARVAKADPDRRAAAFDIDRYTDELVADLTPIFCAHGMTPGAAKARAERLAFVVNSDTLTLLTAGAAAFSPHREATAYV